MLKTDDPALASEKTIERLRANTDAAGLKFTPMVFIDGRQVEIGK